MRFLYALIVLVAMSFGLAPAAMAHEGGSHAQVTQSAGSADAGGSHVSVDGKEVKAKSQASVAASDAAVKSDCGGKKCVGKCSCSMATCCQYVTHKPVNLNIFPPQADQGPIMAGVPTSGIMPEAIAKPPKHS